MNNKYKNINEAFEGEEDDPTSKNDPSTSKLPKGDITGIGFFGPDYNPTDDLLMPHKIGVRDEGSMSATIDAVRGVAYYTDMIGFGAPSNFLTRGMNQKPSPLGINYFFKTGQQCSNGADMWQYVEGIPKGDALGQNVMVAMREVNMPPLKGLVPGIIEDVKAGLNPMPVINSLFGSGYPVCEFEEKSVGTITNMIYKEGAAGSVGVPLIDNPDTAYKKEDGQWYQKKWTQKMNVTVNRNGVEDKKPIYITRDEYMVAPKTHNSDGTPISSEEGQQEQNEEFTDYRQTGLFVTAAILLGVLTYIAPRK